MARSSSCRWYPITIKRRLSLRRCSLCVRVSGLFCCRVCARVTCSSCAGGGLLLLSVVVVAPLLALCSCEWFVLLSCVCACDLFIVCRWCPITIKRRLSLRRCSLFVRVSGLFCCRVCARVTCSSLRDAATRLQLRFACAIARARCWRARERSGRQSEGQSVERGR